MYHSCGTANLSDAHGSRSHVAADGGVNGRQEDKKRAVSARISMQVSGLTLFALVCTESHEEKQQETLETPPATSPSLSHDDVDVTTQMRAWKERCARLEQLLAKKNVKMQEKDETVRLFEHFCVPILKQWPRQELFFVIVTNG